MFHLYLSDEDNKKEEEGNATQEIHQALPIDGETQFHTSNARNDKEEILEVEHESDLIVQASPNDQRY